VIAKLFKDKTKGKHSKTSLEPSQSAVLNERHHQKTLAWPQVVAIA